ncbi:MAG: hypothetical protein LBU32_05265 [Clostridiales bacterium]|nr:hypothetical protein [Clostridiales bacterium]
MIAITWNDDWKKVYVCSPLSAPSKIGLESNRKRAEEYMRQISLRYNCRAVAPHAYMSLFLDDFDPAERKLGIDFGLNFLATCDAVVVCGKTITRGMKMEIETADKLEKPIFYLNA